MSPILISIVVFFGVAALVGAVAMFFRGDENTRAEDRLAVLTSAKPVAGVQNALKESGVLSQPLDATQNFVATFLARFKNLSLLFQQADTTLTPSKFFTISAVMGVGGSVAAGASRNSALNCPTLSNSSPARCVQGTASPPVFAW